MNNKTKEAQNFVNYLRKMKPNRNWPTPIEYVGGGVNGKVYLTNSGKLMKIGLGSNPQEFRPLHILRNTKFVPKFNQKNWAIIPIRTSRRGSYVKEVRNLFNVNNSILFSKNLKNTRTKLKNIKINIKSKRNIIEKQKKRLSHLNFFNMSGSGDRKTIEKYIKNMENHVKNKLKYRKNLINYIKNLNYTKKATVFLMNKIGNKVMTLHSYLKSIKLNNATKNRFRKNVIKMIKQIKLKGISHGNLHDNNILVSVTPSGKIKLWMIDFGRSSIIPIGMTERNMFRATKKFERFYPSKGMLSNIYEGREVPVHSGSRANVHMSNIHYGVPFTRNMENEIRRMRESHI